MTHYTCNCVTLVGIRQAHDRLAHHLIQRNTGPVRHFLLGARGTVLSLVTVNRHATTRRHQNTQSVNGHQNGRTHHRQLHHQRHRAANAHTLSGVTHRFLIIYSGLRVELHRARRSLSQGSSLTTIPRMLNAQSGNRGRDSSMRRTQRKVSARRRQRQPRLGTNRHGSTRVTTSKGRHDHHLMLTRLVNHGSRANHTHSRTRNTRRRLTRRSSRRQPRNCNAGVRRRRRNQRRRRLVNSKVRRLARINSLITQAYRMTVGLVNTERSSMRGGNNNNRQTIRNTRVHANGTRIERHQRSRRRQGGSSARTHRSINKHPGAHRFLVTLIDRSTLLLRGVASGLMTRTVNGLSHRGVTREYLTNVRVRHAVKVKHLRPNVSSRLNAILNLLSAISSRLTTLTRIHNDHNGTRQLNGVRNLLNTLRLGLFISLAFRLNNRTALLLQMNGRTHMVGTRNIRGIGRVTRLIINLNQGPCRNHKTSRSAKSTLTRITRRTLRLLTQAKTTRNLRSTHITILRKSVSVKRRLKHVTGNLSGLINRTLKLRMRCTSPRIVEARHLNGNLRRLHRVTQHALNRILINGINAPGTHILASRCSLTRTANSRITCLKSGTLNVTQIVAATSVQSRTRTARTITTVKSLSMNSDTLSNALCLQGVNNGLALSARRIVSSHRSTIFLINLRGNHSLKRLIKRIITMTEQRTTTRSSQTKAGTILRLINGLRHNLSTLKHYENGRQTHVSSNSVNVLQVRYLLMTHNNRRQARAINVSLILNTPRNSVRCKTRQDVRIKRQSFQVG